MNRELRYHSIKRGVHLYWWFNRDLNNGRLKVWLEADRPTTAVDPTLYGRSWIPGTDTPVPMRDVRVNVVPAIWGFDGIDNGMSATHYHRDARPPAQDARVDPGWVVSGVGKSDSNSGGDWLVPEDRLFWGGWEPAGGGNGWAMYYVPDGWVFPSGTVMTVYGGEPRGQFSRWHEEAAA